MVDAQQFRKGSRFSISGVARKDRVSQSLVLLVHHVIEQSLVESVCRVVGEMPTLPRWY